MSVALQCKCGIPKKVGHECLTARLPIPAEAYTPKAPRVGNNRGRKVSAWPEFFKKWKVGDSVVVNWTTLNTMRVYAAKLDQKIYHERLNYVIDGLIAARVWRIG